MVTTYTLARVLPPKDMDVYNSLLKFKQVKEVIMTYGEYDLLIKIEVNDLDELDQFIFTKIRAVDGISSTTTLIQAEPRFEG
jgi:DNA-binding Lrp family transcriptional regulator